MIMNRFLLTHLVTILFLFFPHGCGYIQESIDIAGLKGMAGDILKNFNPGSPQNLKDFIREFSLERDTQPLFLNKIKVSSLNRWKVDHPLGYELIMEKITFPSLIEHKMGNDTAVFYSYRAAPLRGRRVILWVPGMGVSDLAFRFIKRFFYQELKRDYDILFYVPPYHMERTEDGRDNGDGFFTADTERNIKVILNMVRELRTISHYLEDRGVKSIGGWGGSIGASTILLMAQMVDLDHLCIMIPIVNWETVTLENTYMKKVVSRYEREGFSVETLMKAYGLINPVNYRISVKPERVHIMYAEYDQLSPESAILNFARKNKITRIVSYKRSHATILLSDKLYEHCGMFLDSLK
jgi:hypothetical protein